MEVKYLIIGAGPTGIGAAYRLQEVGEHDYLIIDRSSWVGGLATSFVDDRGFTWDIGGHVQFSHYPYFDRAMSAALPDDEWLEHQRESWVWMKDRFVPYPFQNNIRYLPTDSLWKCLQGIVELYGPGARTDTQPKNFEEWILATFGQGIADEFMLPYNFKVWAYPPRELAYQWIGERVSVVNLARILENVIYERMDASWGPNNVFKFPKHGGTGAIWKSLADRVGRNSRLRLESEVTKIYPQSRKVVLKDGSVIHYEKILSTIPLDHCALLVNEMPMHHVRLALGLRHSASNIIGVGLRGRPPEDIGTKCWMYFPEDNCPFYRVTVFSNYSPYNVPDISQHYSLMCEVSESPLKPVQHASLVQDTIDGLRNTKLIHPDDEVVSTWAYRADYGYPTPSLERDRILHEVIPYLDHLGVYSRGRFGAWKYEVSNQDHSFMQGVEWVNHVMYGEEETTLKIPRNQRLVEAGRKTGRSEQRDGVLISIPAGASRAAPRADKTGKVSGEPAILREGTNGSWNGTRAQRVGGAAPDAGTE